MRQLFRGVVFLFLGTVIAMPAAIRDRSAEVVRVAPSIYEKLSPLLTPADQVLKEWRERGKDEVTSGGVVLLSESVTYRDEAGVNYRLVHTIYHAVDQSAVEGLSTDHVSFDRDRESLFLIEAATISADGTRQAVDAKGTFIQTPQREADAALYTSTAELAVIYPQVAPGVSTELVVLIRENVPVMPGEFASYRTFGSVWPTRLRRFVFDLPTSDWERVNMHQSGGVVPTVVAEKYEAGRERRTWSVSGMKALANEEATPEFRFLVPTLWLTTVKDWDAIARWYSGLVADRSELGDELRELVGKWTAGVTDQKQIVSILHEKVANDVRYTGLEFGLAGFQPYPCQDVWRNRYGDCKDKANLLRAMLAHKGIEAHLVLLSTETLGRVEKKSPSWQQFNHCITAVTVDGETIFCDPAVKYLPSGVLPLGDIGRDVLVLRREKAEWVRTPDKLDAHLNVTAEMALNAAGELSGWLALGAEGSSAASYADYFAGQDSDDLRRSLQRYATLFFPGAEVIDTAFALPEGRVTRAEAKAFIVSASRNAGNVTVKFPFPEGWLPEVITGKKRSFPYGATLRQQTMQTTIALPEGWQPANLPAAFSAPTASAEFLASWRMDGGKLLAELTWRPLRMAILPEDYAAYQQSVRALRSWLEQPVVLAPSGGAKSPVVAAKAGAPDLSEFVVMPTGAGQLRLLDEKYPSGERDEQRRAALAKVLQWFPGDVDTVFTAKTHLALLDWNDGADRAFAATMASLLADYAAKLPVSTRSWGEFLDAKVRWFNDRDPGALEKLKALAADKTVGGYRRGWSAYNAGVFIAESDHAAAVAFLREYDSFDWEARPSIVKLIALSYAMSGDAVGLKDWLTNLAASAGDSADALVSGAVDYLTAKWREIPEQKRGDVVAALGADAFKPLEKAAKGIESLKNAWTIENARSGFVRELRKWLEKNPPEWWTREKLPEFKTVADLTKALDARNDARDGKGTADAALQLIFHFPEASYEDFAKYTRWAMWWLDKEAINQPLVDKLGKLSLELPYARTAEVVEVWDCYATCLAKAKRFTEARRLRERVLKDGTIAEYQRVEAGGELGKLELSQGRVEAALAAFREIEPIHTRHKKGTDWLFISLIVTLERGDLDRGLEIVARMGEQEEKWRDTAENATLINLLVRINREPEKLKRFWQHAGPAAENWKNLLKKNHVSPQAYPIEYDFAAHGKRLAAAIGAGQRQEFLKELDTFARMAHWVPPFANDFAKQVINAARFGPEFRRPLYEHLLLLVCDLEPVEPAFDADARLWEAAIKGDLGQKEEAAVKAEALYRDLGLNNGKGERALIIWAIFSRGGPTAERAMGELAGALQGDRPLASRFDLVSTYSDGLLTQPGKADEHRKMLEREMTLPTFKAQTTEQKAFFENRMKQLQGVGASSEEFGKALEAWKNEYTRAWFDRVGPASVHDPKVAMLTEALEGTKGDITLGESVKFNLLLAADETRAVGVREAAFVSTVSQLSMHERDAAVATDLVLKSLRTAGLSTRSQAMMIGRAVGSFAYADQPEAIEKLLAAREGAGVADGFRKSAEAVVKIQTRWRKQDEAMGKDCVAIAIDAPVDYMRLLMLRQTLKRLVHAGRGEEADRLVASLDGMKIDTTTLNQSAAAIRLQLTREVREAKTHQPFLAAFRDTVLALPSASGAKISEMVRGQIEPGLAGHLSAKQRFALLVHLLKSGRADQDMMWPLFRLLMPEFIPGTEARLAYGPQLLERFLALPGPDSVKAEWAMMCGMICDFDIPEVKAATEPLIKAFLASPEARTYPRTKDAMLVIYAFMELRTSTAARPGALFELLDQSQTPASARMALRHRYHFTRGESEESLAALDAVDADTLAGMPAFGSARLLLKKEGRDAELKLVEETVRAKIASQMTTLWVFPGNLDSLGETLALAVAADAGDLVPDAWFEHVQAMLGETADKLELRVHQALLRKDWPKLFKAADERIKLLPDAYELYYMRALAASQMKRNQPKQIVEDLRTYLKYARSDHHYLEAKALLESLTETKK